MDDSRFKALADLLSRTEVAHGAYETADLGGAYDQDWARWYATYALDHGVATLIGRPITADGLSGLLVRSWEASQRADPTPAEPWATWTARWLLERSA